MFSATFIERPKFAFVISIVIVIAGLVSLGALPITQYPKFAKWLMTNYQVVDSVHSFLFYMKKDLQ